MFDKLTYKITTAIIFIVTAYKRNSHRKAYKVYRQFYKRNADCLQVKKYSAGCYKALCCARKCKSEESCENRASPHAVGIGEAELRCSNRVLLSGGHYRAKVEKKKAGSVSNQ